MPIILGGTQVLPPNIPRPTGWDYAGQYEGDMTRKTLDVLLAAFLGQMNTGGGPFAPKNIPNPGYGQTGSPGTIFQPSQGPIPQGQGPRLPGQQNPQQVMQGIKSATPPSPFASLPMLNAKQFELLKSMQQYKKNQQALDVNSPANQFLTAQAAQMRGTAQAGTNQSKLFELKRRALDGDETAIAALDVLGELDATD